jgi:hypothetical protein
MIPIPLRISSKDAAFPADEAASVVLMDAAVPEVLMDAAEGRLDGPLDHPPCRDRGRNSFEG